RHLGHISFRTRPELHQQLLDIAKHLESDLSGLVNQMIAEALPAFLDRATGIATRREMAQKRFRDAVSPAGPEHDEAVRLAVAAGRDRPEPEQLKAMYEAVAPLYQGTDVALPAVLRTAQRHLEEEEENERIEK